MMAETILVFYTLFEVELKPVLFLAMVLFFPLNVWGQSVLPLSCEDVTKIEVWRLRGAVWHCPSQDGYSYAVIVHLTEKAQKRMAQIYESTEKTPFMVDDCRFLIRHMQIEAGGKSVPSDSPTMDNFRDDAAIITKKTKDAAFEAARTICPDKAPTVMLTDGS